MKNGIKPLAVLTIFFVMNIGSCGSSPSPPARTAPTADVATPALGNARVPGTFYDYINYATVEKSLCYLSSWKNAGSLLTRRYRLLYKPIKRSIA